MSIFFTTDPNQIRNKRLAKLGGNGGTSPASSQDAAPTQPTITTSPSPTEKRSASPGTVSASSPRPSGQNPFTQLGMKSEAQAPRISITTSASTPQKRDNGGSARAKSKQAATSESLDVWEDKQLSHIFRLSLKPEMVKDVQGRSSFFLAGLRADLVDESQPLLLKTSHLDQALTEAGSGAVEAGEKPLDYLLGCWKRVARAFRSTKTTDMEAPRQDILREARRLCMSYCIFAVVMPEMFNAESTGENELAKHLLVDPESDTGVCHDFLSEATSRFDEDDLIKDALVGAVEQLSRELAKMSMNDNYKPHVNAMRNLVRFPALAAAITESPNFVPANTAAQNIETKTILGPFFRLSPMQSDVAQNYFSAPRTRDKGYIANAQNSLRMTLYTHQEELFDIANCIIRASKSNKEPRERMLDWFALAVNANHKRRAMRPDYKTISSDGFMVNVTAILDQLCDPFIDATFSKIDRVDVDYLRRNPRVSIQDETKINADQKTSDAFYENKADGTNNFISEVFFLTVAAHHYGTESANTQLTNMQKQVKHMEKELDSFEAQRATYLNRPQYLTLFEARLKQFKDDVDKIHSIIHATMGVLLDETVQARSMQFMRFVIVWLLRLASGQNLPKDSLKLPLPETEPEVFKCLPEYLLEDIVGNFKFITRHIPHIITSTQCEELVTICIAFLRSSEYIKSPYLKSGLVTILYYGVWAFGNHTKGVLGDLLNGSTFAHKHLLHALMKFYIEAESTGTHTQFFDKFNIRYEIDQIIKCIWPNAIYRENLAKEAT